MWLWSYEFTTLFTAAGAPLFNHLYMGWTYKREWKPSTVKLSVNNWWEWIAHLLQTSEDLIHSSMKYLLILHKGGHNVSSTSKQ